MQETFSSCILIICIACCNSTLGLPSSSRLCLPCTVLLSGERLTVWTCQPACRPRAEPKAPCASRAALVLPALCAARVPMHSPRPRARSRQRQSWQRGHLPAPRSLGSPAGHKPLLGAAWCSRQTALISNIGADNQ